MQARIILAARRQSKLDEAAAKLRASGAKVLAISADVTQADDVARVAAKTMQEFGGLDVLVNNAGRSARGDVLSISADDFARRELNFLSVVRCTRTFADTLIERHGHIVNIGSLASKSATRFMGTYPASKFPLAAYSQQLRLELGPRGLHVLLVCPGPIARRAARVSADQFAGAAGRRALARQRASSCTCSTRTIWPAAS